MINHHKSMKAKGAMAVNNFNKNFMMTAMKSMRRMLKMQVNAQVKRIMKEMSVTMKKIREGILRKVMTLKQIDQKAKKM